MNEFEQARLDRQLNFQPQNRSNPINYNNNYREVLSQASDNLAAKQQQLIFDPKPEEQKLQKAEYQYKLRLPNVPHDEAQQSRNKYRQGRNGKILIERQEKHQQLQMDKLQGQKKGKQLKIYDLIEEAGQNQEKIIETQNFVSNERKQIVPIQIMPQKRQRESQVSENQSNSFLDVEDDFRQKQEEPMFQKNKMPEMKIFQTSNNNVVKVQPNDMSKRQRLREGVKTKGMNIKKGLFFQQMKDEIEYQLPKNGSKSSLDTGVQVTVSRDEFSSRQILAPFSPGKTKKHLPSLKPLNQMLNRKQEQLYTLKQYDKLEVLKQKQKRMKALSNGKFGIVKESISDVYSFVHATIPFDQTLEATIARNKKWSKMGYLDYDLETIDGKYLLSCKKMPFNLGSTYNISLAKNSFTESSGYLVGKVSGNFVGTTFNIYRAIQSDERQLEATIYYSPQWMCCKVQTRQIQVYVKNSSFRFGQLEGSQNKNKNLKQLYTIQSNREIKRIFKFVSKEPVWHPQLQLYIMNFRGKSKFPSVKNMILISCDEKSQEGLLLSKKDENQFELDISYPFTPLIALGVAMTSFDFKLASQ